MRDGPVVRFLSARPTPSYEWHPPDRFDRGCRCSAVAGSVPALPAQGEIIAVAVLDICGPGDEFCEREKLIGLR